MITYQQALKFHKRQGSPYCTVRFPSEVSPNFSDHEHLLGLKESDSPACIERDFPYFTGDLKHLRRLAKQRIDKTVTMLIYIILTDDQRKLSFSTSIQIIIADHPHLSVNSLRKDGNLVTCEVYDGTD